MNRLNYVYNPKTCQYERARVTVKDVLVVSLSTLALSVLFFLAIIFIHNRFVETDLEARLRAENKVLKANLPVVEAELSKIESNLMTLNTQEKTIYTKLFNQDSPEGNTSTSSLNKEDVLLADASSFKDLLADLENKSRHLLENAKIKNNHFGEHIHVTSKDVSLLGAIPSFIPIEYSSITQFASGFGQRLNPFHKGMYFHPGIDLVAARGTNVMVTAPGKVKSVSKSNLQAGYGNQVVVDHGEGFVTRYAHMEEILVKPGQVLSRGTVIGTVGNSGGSVAPHLHYEITRDGEHVDPALYLLENLTSAQHQNLLIQSKKQNQSLD